MTPPPKSILESQNENPEKPATDPPYWWSTEGGKEFSL
jgi:hypothetical protein